MNPRRVHELMRQHFPSVDAASREWINIAAPEGLREPELIHLLERFIPADFVLIELHRRLGDYLARDDAIKFAATHLGEGEIHIADRDFRGFVVIGHNGVATGWFNDK